MEPSAFPGLEVVRWSPSVLTYGGERHNVGGTEVYIASVAKTVANCLKFRKNVGGDLAVQAVKKSRRKRLPIDELFAAAEVRRVEVPNP